MRFRQHIAAFSLLTSVLLGGVIAPLSHFAFMAFSDTYAMPMGMSMADGHMHAGMDGDASVHAQNEHTGHLDCPYAAFFLHQAPAVASDTPTLVQQSLEIGAAVDPSLVPGSTAILVAPARGPPPVSA